MSLPHYTLLLTSKYQYDEIKYLKQNRDIAATINEDIAA